jgi:hypothetical protein
LWFTDSPYSNLFKSCKILHAYQNQQDMNKYIDICGYNNALHCYRSRATRTRIILYIVQWLYFAFRFVTGYFWPRVQLIWIYTGHPCDTRHNHGVNGYTLTISWHIWTTLKEIVTNTFQSFKDQQISIIIICKIRWKTCS